MKVDLLFMIAQLVFLHASSVAYSTDNNCLLSSESIACENDGKDCMDKLLSVVAEKDECLMTYDTMYRGGNEDFRFSIRMTSNTTEDDNKFLIITENTTTGNKDIIENCCGVKETESCLLRPKRKDENFVLIYLDGDENSCYKHIQDQPRSFTLCDAEKNNRPCLGVEKGNIFLYKCYDDTSTAKWKPMEKENYCIFEVPVSLVAEIDDEEDGIVDKVTGFHLNETTFHVAGANVTCQKNDSKQIKNLNEHMKSHKKRGYTMCSFIGVEKIWFPTLSCFQKSDKEKGLPPTDPPSLVTIGVTVGCVAGISVFICLVLVALYAYRKVFPPFQQTEKEIPKLLRNADAEEPVPEVQQRRNIDEIPCEIVCEDEIPANLESAPQSNTNDEKNEEIPLLFASESQEYVGYEEAQAANSTNSPTSILQNSSQTSIRNMAEVDEPHHPDDHSREHSFSATEGFQELSPFLANDVEFRFGSDGQGYVRKEMDAGCESGVRPYTKKTILSQNGFHENTTARPDCYLPEERA